MKRLRVQSIIIRCVMIVLLSVRAWGVSEENTTLPLFVHGVKQLDIAHLYDALDVDRAPAWMFWRDHTPKIKRAVANKAESILRPFLDSEGFYDATYRMVVGERNATLYITEGEPVRIQSIVTDTDYNLSNVVTFHRGDIFRAEDFIQIKSDIVDTMLKEGYCSYDLDTKAYVDLDKHRVDVRYKLRKGKPCRFGKATVKGLQSIDPRIVLSRVRAKEGRRFSKELLQATSSAVYNLKAFDGVAIDANRKIYNTVPVDIRVQEITKPYHIELGAGYDTYVGPRVHATLHKYNFLGDAKQLRLRLAWSKLEKIAIVEYDQPMLFTWQNYAIDYGFRGGYSDLEFDGFRESKYFITNFLRYEGYRFDLTAGLSAESIDISRLSEGDNLLPEYAYDTFFLVYPYLKAIYDRRDSKLDPKEGYYLKAYLEYGLPTTSDASRYLKWEAEARYIHTWRGFTGAIVGKIGTVRIFQDSAGGIPESKKFFSGGAYSNRAYGFRELGVLVSPTQDLVNGAQSMANLTLEVDHRIRGKLSGAVFCDNTILNADSHDFSTPVLTSVGVGVRYQTPVGPFKLDVGFNVHDPSQYGIIFQIGQSF